jgi:hypothetical protein
METRKPMEILPEERKLKSETRKTKREARNLEDDGRAGESRQCAKARESG